MGFGCLSTPPHPQVWEGNGLGGGEEPPVSGNQRVSWEKGQAQGFRGGLELRLQSLGFRGQCTEYMGEYTLKRGWGRAGAG